MLRVASYVEHAWRQHHILLLLLLSLFHLLLPELHEVRAQVCVADFEEALLQEIVVLCHELVDFHRLQDLMTEATIVSLVTLTSRVYPLAREHFGCMRVRTVRAPLAIVLHEVFAELVGQIV